MKYVGLALIVMAVAAPLRVTATPHVLVWANELDVTTLMPYEPGSTAKGILDGLTQAYLMRDFDGTLEPELAERVPSLANGGVSADGRTIRIRLRPSLRWSDGAALTSADVAYSIRTLTSEARTVVAPDGFGTVSGVDTPDDRTVIVHARRFSRELVRSLFSSDSLPVLPVHVHLGRDLSPPSAEYLPVGAGPFRYETWHRGDRVTLVPNPYYQGRAPKLRRIVLRMLASTQASELALRTGEINFWPVAANSSAAALASDPHVTAIVSPGVHPQFLMLNTASEPLRDRSVRQALRAAVDRAAIVKKTYHAGAVVDDTPLAANDPEYAAVVPERFDPARAKRLLDAAGWLPGADGVRVKGGRRLRLRIVGVANVPAVAHIMEAVRSNWRDVGVELETRIYAGSVLFDEDPQRGILSGRHFDVALYSFQRASAGDLAVLFGCAPGALPTHNLSGLCDRGLDRLFREYDTAIDENHARAVARAIQRRLIGLVPAIVLVKRNEYYLKRDSVTGFVLHPFSPVAGAILEIDVAR